MKLSLRAKTVLGIAIIEGFMLVLLVMMLLDFIRETNTDSMERRGESIARLFATTTQDAVLSYDLASLDSFVREVMNNPGMVYARVLTDDDVLLAQAGDIGRFTESARVVDAENPSHVFVAEALIRAGGAVYGKVQVGLDTSEIEAAVADARHWSTLIVMLEMGLVAAFSTLLGLYLTRRLNELRQAAERVSTGQLDVNIPESGSDETALVSRTFNLMVRNLRQSRIRAEQYQQELEQLNAGLEQRVQARTEELRSRNDELERANSSIRAQQARLVQSERLASVGQLAAGVAHEINNPVAYVYSNLQALISYQTAFAAMRKSCEQLLTSAELGSHPQVQALAAALDDQDIDYLLEDLPDLLQDSIDGCRRITEIVSALNEFSRGGSSTRWVETDLNRCITTTIRMVRAQFKYQQVDIETDLQPLPEVLCAEGQIKQVLLNLLVNAAYACKEQGRISISSVLDEAAQRIRVSVRDTGCGIDADDLARLFDPFYTTKPVGEGTGLGLAIAYSIVQEHEGDLEVTSTPGQGSCFTLVLPRRPSQPLSDLSGWRSEAEGQSGRG
ncbi:hypothetical protein GCM10009104_31000 [Marinobacterium maritimum]|uniref:histidine kinase n=1 Tax=Marinobacterium maritimum TaxID=500162 RepID=A0ABN1I9U4_9GAMM